MDEHATDATWRCPVCARPIEAWPASRHDGRLEGDCPRHGLVVAALGDRLTVLAARHLRAVT